VVRVSPEPEVAAVERLAVAARVAVEAQALQLQLRLMLPRQFLPAAVLPLKPHHHQALLLPC
jgi:hypothetical protein